MKKILYIGNNLNNKKSNTSSIQVLGTLLETEGFEMHYASSKNNKVLRLFDMVWNCITMSKKIDYVLIDTYSTTNFYYALVVSQLCSLLKLKYIPILHGGNLPDRLKQSPKLSKMIFHNAHKNVSPSLYLLETFKNNGYLNVDFIPNAIEMDSYTFKERNFKNINLLWVRSFSKIYNPKLAVKVLKGLQVEGFHATLCMVGPDSDGSLLEVMQLAKSLHVDVTFTGKLTKEAWITLSKDFNIFINTTNFDNMPVSVIEAMALGLPVISTNVGGLPFLIANNIDGVLVAKDHEEGFVKAVKSIVNNPEKTKIMTNKAREKVIAFDWELVKTKWFQVLE
ncbi:glycosyltransferase family 4 protein [Oceanihabitans sp. 2_MG-2023]|uniref:glycosyltransferase family 4 protein n=1 Tax=Oceanihabitans sp. 2_MG-2023 TaxID=3062661 RepID=UPI0026E18457|nr:glycosyltransferase family 4 protein [Oceanihabitans sp. 2_MG-2023]MDO6597704.1 glycosyltransferase family 4 protein [Oceanihabitans sp. 2_MG-2023]